MSIGLNSPTTLIKNSMDRRNVYMCAIPITPREIATRQDLQNWIPKNCRDPGRIPKTMVFIDSKRMVCDTADLLEACLHPELRGRNIIMDYSTIISVEQRKEIIKGFHAGIIRVLVCTEAAGIGVDIPDVEVVIQWTIPVHLNLSGWVQRAGRAGRNPAIQAIAVLYYNPAIEVMSKIEKFERSKKHKSQKQKLEMENLKRYACAWDNEEECSQVMREIHAFDMGGKDSISALYSDPAELFNEESELKFKQANVQCSECCGASGGCGNYSGVVKRISTTEGQRHRSSSGTNLHHGNIALNIWSNSSGR